MRKNKNSVIWSIFNIDKQSNFHFKNNDLSLKSVKYKYVKYNIDNTKFASTEMS